MDDLNYLLKLCARKDWSRRRKPLRAGKQIKKCMTVAIFVAADGSKPCNPVVILQKQLFYTWKVNWFWKLTVPTHAAGLYCFANEKSWMNTEIMEHILGRFDRQLELGNCHVILFPFKTHKNSSNWLFFPKK